MKVRYPCLVVDCPPTSTTFVDKRRF
jgi:hypothetical protein